jgi:hypothetical protein
MAISLGRITGETKFFDDYHFPSVIGMNYLFYGTKEKRDTYGSIMTKLNLT